MENPLEMLGMVYDYWMYRGDEEYVKTLLPQIRQVLSWYEQWLQPDGSLSSVPYWFFCDWAAGYPGGMPIREKEGHSAYQDLVYLMALDEVAKMETKMGISALSQHAYYYQRNTILGFNSLNLFQKESIGRR